MKSFQIPLLSMSMVGLCLLSGLDSPAAHADFTFGEPVNIQSDFPFLDPETDALDCFSADGLEMYFDSPRTGGQGGWDIWVSKRPSVEDDWGPPEDLGAIVNSTSEDGGAFISGDGLEIYFFSTRPEGYGSWDIYVTKRATRTSPWGPATNLGPAVNTAGFDAGCSVSSDGLEFYFKSDCPDGYGAGDLYVCTRAATDDPWGDPVNLGPSVNGPADDAWPRLSPDGLLLFTMSDRPEGYGDYDIWVTRRANRSAPWDSPVNLGPIVNGVTADGWHFIHPGGSALYYGSPNEDWSVWNNWQVPIIPTVDFNADGKVDLDDLRLLIDNWGTDNTLYDIGPYAWGDGIVDAQDLMVLAEHMVED